MYGQKDVSGMPPCRTTSRYVSVQPSHGLIAARCGGWSSATRHWDTVRYDTPDRPTFPLLHGCVPTHSMSSAKRSASAGEQYVARPSEYQVPGMSASTIAYPCGTQYTGSGASNVVSSDVSCGRTPLLG